MTLRKQLLLVSLLTLVLPWAGCEFIQETETALREGQTQLLTGTAVAIAESLSLHHTEFLKNTDDVVSQSQVYAHPLSRAPVIDGYFDDWPLDKSSLRSLRGTKGTHYFTVGIHRQSVYLYVDVRDAEVRYADQSASDADKLVVTSDQPNGELSQLVFATEAPGRIAVRRSIGPELVNDSRVSAHWLDTPNGYRIEARMPRSLLGNLFGLQINNAGSGQSIVSSTFSRDRPGRLIMSSRLLTSVAAGFVQRGMRLTLTDPAGWRLATVGTLSTDTEDSAIPTGWQLIIYRTLLKQGDAAMLAEPDPSGYESQTYVAQALSGEATSRWFRNPQTGRAVVSVAQPIWSGNTQTGALILQQDTDAILSLTNASLMRLITVTLLATAVVALALIGYASWLSLRIRNLSHAAEHALDDRKPASELPSAYAADEVGDLSRSFSSVLQELAAYNDYLRTLASKLSHELRTPLTIVTSSLENLDHEPLSPQSREYTLRASTGARRLRRILTAMSEASRVEQLIENIDKERFNLGKVLDSTVAAYRDAWPTRRFSYTTDGETYDVEGSPELIVQMLDKLIDNAVDFSPTDATISIELQRDDNSVLLLVSNPGPPLPETMQHRLFQSMVSLRSGPAGENLGLGLNIAKLIVSGHGGSIHGENTDEGVRFVVRLPCG